MSTYQFISLNLSVALFLCDPQKITLKKAASINILDITSLLLSGASFITVIPRLTKIIRSGITFVSRNLR